MTYVGQIEIDEIYVGINRHGCQFVVPVQAKGGNDKHGVAQKLPGLTCRAVPVQFMSENRIAMFELTVQDGDIKVVDAKHYQLLPAKAITTDDLRMYVEHGD
jgi:hypothetical protein